MFLPLCSCLRICFSHKASPTNPPAALGEGMPRVFMHKDGTGVGSCPLHSSLLARRCLLPRPRSGTGHPGSPSKHVLLGTRRPSNNPALDARPANDTSQPKISATHFSRRSLGIFHSLNSLLLIPSFYCKISESSSLPPTPTELETRT